MSGARDCGGAPGPAQCRACQYGLWRGGRVIDCRALAGERASPRVAEALQTLLYSLAGERTCPMLARWEAQPDTYLSADQPDSGVPLAMEVTL